MIDSLSVARLRNPNMIQDFKTRQIILLKLTDKANTREKFSRVYKSLQERDNNYRNIQLSCSRAALLL